MLYAWPVGHWLQSTLQPNYNAEPAKPAHHVWLRDRRWLRSEDARTPAEEQGCQRASCGADPICHLCAAQCRACVDVHCGQSAASATGSGTSAALVKPSVVHTAQSALAFAVGVDVSCNPSGMSDYQ